MEVPQELKNEPAMVQQNGEEKLNPVLRLFLFNTLKVIPPIKKIRKIYRKGLTSPKVESIAMIVTPEKKSTKLRLEGGIEESIDITDKEIDSLLVALKVDKEKLKENKSVFVVLDFKTKIVYYQQTKKDGTKINITI